MKIKKIKWRDSQMFNGQWTKDDKFDVAIVESLGFLVEETKEHIVLAGDLIDTDYRRVIVIPKENIIK